jgi:hypothetical protein
MEKTYEVCPHCGNEVELDAELKAVTTQIEKVSSFADDTAEQVETVYKAVSTMSSENLVNTILDHAVVDGKIITFYLTGGLYFREEI